MYQIRQLCVSPAVYIINEFLSQEECQALIDVALEKHLTDFKMLGTGSHLNKKHWKSRHVFIENKENETINKIKKRINRIIKLPFELQEPMQIAQYPKSGFYTYHWDFDHAKTEVADRLVSFMIYLNDVEEGGETELPILGIRVIPKRGRAIFWYNYKGLKLPEQEHNAPKQVKLPSTFEADYETMHAGLPIKHGEKWIALQLYSLDKEQGKVIKLDLAKVIKKYPLILT